jgi:hypothetical protein
MFLSAVLFVLFVAGCWLYCLADAVLTPAAEVPGLRKPVWIAVIAVTFILGAIAWVIARRWWRTRHRPLKPAARPGLTGYGVLNVPEDPDRPTSADRLAAAEALARHPASRSRNMPGPAAPIGPDDDPEFLRMLDRLISGTPDSSELSGILTVLPHRDFDSQPQISSFNSITSTFADTSPDSGIYEDAYDIWLNGIGGANATEVMIWTDNHGQTPSGSVQGTVTMGGRSYTVWKTTGNYIAFVPSTNFTSASMDLLAFFKWLMSKGWITDSATLGQVDYGVELVSTGGVPATFTFSDFSVNAS